MGHRRLAQTQLGPTLLALALGIVGGLCLSACSSAPAPTTTTTTMLALERHAPHLGTTQVISGEHGKADVTVLAVVALAKDANGNSPLAGSRYLGVKITFRALTATFSDDADRSLALIATNTQSYGAQFSAIMSCPNFANGQVTLGRGELAVGCVEFQMPIGVQPAVFLYTGEDGQSRSPVIWADAA